jgi:hypothetical protein
MHLKEPEWEGMYWIDLGQDRNKHQVLMNMVIKLWVPSKAEKFLTSWRTISFLRRILLHGGYILHMHSNNNSMESK